MESEFAISNCTSQSIQNGSLQDETIKSYLSSLYYEKCRLLDIPKAFRTRELLIASFNRGFNQDVYDYIQAHISDFNRQFFKDLIACNDSAMRREKNCFTIMPLEYIDEEMCAWAILHAVNWDMDAWFYTVYKRKREALTEDVWKLGARLYSRVENGQNKFLEITPDAYKDQDYYKEMCSCNFHGSYKLIDAKGEMMDSIPQEIVTEEFLVALLLDDFDNIARFNEKALETQIGTQKLWQIVVEIEGAAIQNIPLNDERVAYFLNHYDKDSKEYRCYFKDKYKRYMKQKNNPEALAKIDRRTQHYKNALARVILSSANPYSQKEENLSLLMDDFEKVTEDMRFEFLPIQYHGVVPEKLCKEYDQEEYLEMVYKKMGIEMIEEFDNLFYQVDLPEGWSIERDGYECHVKDRDGNIVIEYYHNSKLNERAAYVEKVNFSSFEMDDSKKIRMKTNKK